MNDSQDNFFKQQRERLGLTQRDLSIRLDMTTGAISNWERGSNLPRPQLFDRIAAAYEVAPERIALAVLELARSAAA